MIVTGICVVCLFIFVWTVSTVGPAADPGTKKGGFRVLWGQSETIHIIRNFTLTVASCISVIMPGDFKVLCT